MMLRGRIFSTKKLFSRTISSPAADRIASKAFRGGHSSMDIDRTIASM
jgi:hypothetical protein